MEGLVIALTLCLNDPAVVAEHGIEPRACYELRIFDRRVECDLTARAMKVHTRGARLRCIPRELSPDEKVQIARDGGRPGA
ncbi:MAG: hypothetical protein A3D94_18395 [Alphaproteobacteria bacterium RIFCSPHIGHO2_12_FULL_66_14]|jgi:hypothetical protein|nr:MAG: hypothetical protein A3D94_18395 [Alphaproteobacteria bacterium RIFCSPHIGHO2_12_FULL_66_14]